MNGIETIDLTTVLGVALSAVLALGWGAAYSRLVVWLMDNYPQYLLLLLLPLSAVGVGIALVLTLPVLGIGGLMVVYIALGVAAVPVVLIVGPHILADMKRQDKAERNKDGNDLGFGA